MDKTAIKNFSIWARNKLIADITYKAGLLGVTEEGIKDALPQSTQEVEFYDIGTKEPYAIHGEEIKQRKELVAAIKRKATQLAYKDAYRNVVEEVAYTWFNRLIAIRFMEVNDYMPAHIRVLSSESKNKLEPDLVTTPFDAEIDFAQAETEKIMQMKTDNQVDALFRFLFIKQCNALNAYLPKLFEKTSDYTELLLNVSVTDQDGIVYHLTHDINEADFNISDLGEDGKPTGQVEIIGWMYQFYNTEPKDMVFSLLKKNVKITKENVPAATQLFTPDWIVRYMVENSVGRLWLEGHEDSNLKDEWKYYLDEAEQEANVAEQLRTIREEYKNIKPDEIKVIDPCMGSGHILVYAFDVLMQIYESYGYSQRDAAQSIVENNIYGLDIDDRAFQLAYFAIMMKARSYNRRFLTLGIEPNLCAIQESNGLEYDSEIGESLLSEEHRETLKYLLHTFRDAKEYGSILEVEQRDYNGFLEVWKLLENAVVENVVTLLWYAEYKDIVSKLANQASIMSRFYDSVITNPPYMGNTGMNPKLSEYVKKNYPETKSDMSTVCMEKTLIMCKPCGYIAMINIPVWMSLTSYEKLRRNLIENNTFINMLHLGRGVFGSDFGTTSFVIAKKRILGYVGEYRRLFNTSVEVVSIETKEKWFFEGKGKYIAEQSNYKKIPGVPISYWVDDVIYNAYNYKPLGEDVIPRHGLATSDNNRFLKLWYEVDINRASLLEKCDYSKKWYPMNKGGAYRKWYGNLEWIINYEEDGKEIKDFAIELYKCSSRTIQNTQFYFKKALTWSALTSGSFSVRWSDEGAIFGSGAHCAFAEEKQMIYALGFMNSKIMAMFLQIVSPSLNYNVDDIRSTPFIQNDKKDDICNLVEKCISISKMDWDSFETSWDFKKHPLVSHKEQILSDGIEYSLKSEYQYWEKECSERFELLRNCEEEQNRLFIEMYDVQDRVSAEVEDKDVTVSKADLSRDIKSFLSYAVGCMFGRYSLDEEGLVYAGGAWKPERYKRFIPDKDNVIIISDEGYFSDDIVGRLIDFIKAIFGEDTLEDNLEYIAEALGTKGNSSRERIRNYFLNEFEKEHGSMYSTSGSGKRPIYWLFDSGKQNGFKALVYMHRYDEDTIGNLRIDYLHRMERIYESEINRMQDTIDNSSNAREVTAATKRKEKLQKQLKECREYDEKIGHLALSRISIDLDEGVKANYEKIQTASDGKKYQVLAKI